MVYLGDLWGMEGDPNVFETELCIIFNIRAGT